MSFYKTQISKIGAGFAVDTFGKKLIFVGNYPCQAGDYVWTDGTVIFGNISNKTQTVFWDEIKNGIPVLAGDLRGFFDDSGKFFKYNVFQDYWIINNSKFFKHGKKSFWDVEISDSGEIFTAFWDADSKSLIIQRDGVTIQQVSEEQFLQPFKDIVFEVFKVNNDIDGVTATVDEHYFPEFHLNSVHLNKDGSWSAFCSVDIILWRVYKFLNSNIAAKDDNGNITDAFKTTYNKTGIYLEQTDDYSALAQQIADNIRATLVNYSIVTGDEPLESWVAHSNIMFSLITWWDRFTAVNYMEITEATTEKAGKELVIETDKRFIGLDSAGNKKYEPKWIEQETRIEYIFRACFNSNSLDNPNIFLQRCVTFKDLDYTDTQATFSPPSKPVDDNFQCERVDVVKTVELTTRYAYAFGLFLPDEVHEEKTVATGDDPYYITHTRYRSNAEDLTKNPKFADFNNVFQIPVPDDCFISAKCDDEILTADKPVWWSSLPYALMQSFFDGKLAYCSALFSNQFELIADLSNFNILPFYHHCVAKVNKNLFLFGSINSDGSFLAEIRNKFFKVLSYSIRNFRLRKLKNISKAGR